MTSKFGRVGKVAAALAATALALTACSGNGDDAEGTSGEGASTAPATDAPQGGEQVSITLGWWGGDARTSSTLEAIEAFNAEYPNITVEPQYTDWNGYWDQLATLTAAGDAPDIMQMDELYLASYGARGALADMASLEIDTSRLEEASLGTGVVSGTQYAIPHSVTTLAVIANKDLFDKYSVELPDDESWTWDDYASIAAELTEKSGGEIHGSTLVGGFDVGALKHWARTVGNEIFDEEGNVILEPQVLADLWQYQFDMIESGGMQSAPAIVESFNAGISAGALATHKVALGLQWNTQISALADASGANLVLLKLPQPADVNPASLKPGMYWAISSQSDHPEEAAKLVDFLINSQAAADIIQTERGIPANLDIREYLTPNLEGPEALAVEFLNRVEVGDAPPITPIGASGVEGILQRYTQEVLAGQNEPLAAAEAAIAELQSEIDNAR